MGESLSNRQLARLAAAFFVVAGAIGCLRALTIVGPEVDRDLLLSVSGVAAAVGVAAWFAPWNAWPRGALLSMALLALVLKAFSNLAGGTNPHIYVVHYAVLFMWFGVALPGWARAACVPLFMLSYSLPTLMGASSVSGIASLVVVGPACIFLGELAAWVGNQARNAERSSLMRAQEMATLVDATLTLAACQDLRELGRLTASGAVHLLGGERSAVLVLDGQRGLSPVGEVGWKRSDPMVPAEVCAEIRSALCREGDTLEDPQLRPRVAEALGLESVALVPLLGSNGRVGVALVAFDGPRGPRDEFSEYVLQTFATQAGLGFERLHAAAALRDESLHDALTGIGNRRKAAEALEVLKPGDALALIDLDHFKSVNDNYGHAAGDRVLRTLAEYLRSCIRLPDEVFRYGGEEFLMVLRGGREGAAHAVARIHRGWVGQHRVTSWSAGIAVCDPEESAEDALARADVALYAAKRAGRDRVLDWCQELAGATAPEEDSSA